MPETFRPRLEVLEERTLMNAGTLDPSFGTGGIVVNAVGPNYSSSILAVQPDGKFVDAIALSSNSFEVARQNADGTPDTTFGQGGSVVINAPFSAYAILVEPNGDILLGGDMQTGSAELEAQNDIYRPGPPPSQPILHFGLVQLSSDGTLDTSFGVGGMVTTAFTQTVTTVSNNNPDYSQVVFADGSPVADGSLSVANSGVIANFGTTISMTTAAMVDNVDGMALAPNGDIVLAGSSFAFGAPGSLLALARYLPNGQLDQSFGNGGMVLTPVGGGAANAVAVTPSGQIVVTGSLGMTTGNPAYESYMSTFVARYNTDGSLDTTFGTDGIVQPTPTGTVSDPSSIVVMPNGDVAVLTNYQSAVYPIAFTDAIFELTPSGTLDPSFGNGGEVVTDIDNPEGSPTMALEGDGKLLIAGTNYDPLQMEATAEGLNNNGYIQQVTLARFNSDGSVDPTFGNDGQVSTAFGQTTAIIGQMVIAPDGSIDLVAMAHPGLTAGQEPWADLPYNSPGTVFVLRFQNDYGSAADSGGSSSTIIPITSTAPVAGVPVSSAASTDPGTPVSAASETVTNTATSSTSPTGTTNLSGSGTGTTDSPITPATASALPVLLSTTTAPAFVLVATPIGLPTSPTDGSTPTASSGSATDDDGASSTPAAISLTTLSQSKTPDPAGSTPRPSEDLDLAMSDLDLMFEMLGES